MAMLKQPQYRNSNDWVATRRETIKFKSVKSVSSLQFSSTTCVIGHARRSRVSYRFRRHLRVVQVFDPTRSRAQSSRQLVEYPFSELAVAACSSRGFEVRSIEHRNIDGRQTEAGRRPGCDLSSGFSAYSSAKIPRQRPWVSITRARCERRALRCTLRLTPSAILPNALSDQYLHEAAAAAAAALRERHEEGNSGQDPEWHVATSMKYHRDKTNERGWSLRPRFSLRSVLINF